ncbi:hypothetical protein [Alteribacillus bidgolensis]|uniref:Gluconate 2-dehydrogenase gamma chain n=1 Tax=Alteribacillus bidgolensis TaxID=930129 RepID=A0A1G8G505_9BACI|nr:hypothetical protein [Alteribacillus bidgolensis]SDH89494.1 gluconate 2-dehydrogenase gamma chain [Alteribacillus bidgolensis]
MAEDKKNSTMTRRKFLKNSGFVAGGAIGGGLFGSIIGRNLPGGTTADPSTDSQSNKNFNQAFMYFRRQSD